MANASGGAEKPMDNDRGINMALGTLVLLGIGSMISGYYKRGY